LLLVSLGKTQLISANTAVKVGSEAAPCDVKSS